MNAPAAATFVNVPIEKAFLGENYRKRRPKNFDAKIDELAVSIRQKGLIEPLVFRPRPKGKKDEFEVVCGERRYLGSKKAGLATLMGTVRDISDDDVLELQVIENNQREDPHPLDEADGFALLVKRGRSPGELADRLGREVRYVRERLALCTLTEKCRKALDDEQITFGVALVIARIPHPKLQDEALKGLVPFKGDPPMTVKAAGEEIRTRFMLKLVDAPFDRADVELVTKAGACTTCPKRTGNQAELFGDVASPDVCTDRLCFESKLDAQWRLVQAQAKRDGKKVLAEGEAKKVWPYQHNGDRVAHDSPFKPLDGALPAPGTGREVSIRALLKGRDFDTVVGRSPHSGRFYELVAKGSVDAALRVRAKTRGKDDVGSSKKKPGAAEKAERARAKAKVEAKEAIDSRLLAELAEAVQDEAKGSPFLDTFVGVLLEPLFMSGDGLQRVLRRRGLLDEKKRLAYGANIELVKKQAKAQGIEWLCGLLVETVVADVIDYDYGPRDMSTRRANEALEAFGIDRKKVEKQVLAEIAANRAKESKPAAGVVHLFIADGTNGTACGGRASGTKGSTKPTLKGVTCENCKRVGPAVLRDRAPKRKRGKR